MDTNPGWTYEGQWAWGDPAGTSGDPGTGYTGNNVVGYNLNGSYPNNLPETFCTTQSIDCSQASEVILSYYSLVGHRECHVGSCIRAGFREWRLNMDHDLGSYRRQRCSKQLGLFGIQYLRSGSRIIQCEDPLGYGCYRFIGRLLRMEYRRCDGVIRESLRRSDSDTRPDFHPTPPPTSTPEECVNDGDVNLTGDITAGDAQMAFQIALGLITPTEEQECAADCNSDGTITAGDAQQIFMTALGTASCVDPL